MKKANKKLLVRSLKIIGICLCLLIVGVGGFFGVTVFNQISSFSSDGLLNKESTVQISIETGEEYYTQGSDGARKTVAYDDIPQVMIDAVVAAEDSRYFEHNGFDLPRIVKALMGNITSGGITGGGSTITQQVIKNSYYLNAEKETLIEGLQRKLGEVVLSMKLTAESTKEEVLELYLNKIYFGYGNKTIGIYNACRYYFDKDVQELTLPEAALLAGTLNSPNRYDPFRNLDLATQRRNTILDLMVLHGYISENECESAKSIPVENTLKSNPINNGGYYQAYADMVTREVIEETGLDPNSTPMKIYTYIDTDVQKRLDDISNSIDYKFYDEFIQAGACVQQVNNGRIVGVLSSRDYAVLGSTNAYAKNGQKTGGYGQTHQPGSTLKPIIAYGAAFEHLDWSTAHYVNDIPMTYNNGMSPKNHDGNFHGDLSIKSALANSWNLAALHTFKSVVDKIGTDGVTEYLEGFGFDMTGEEMALGYAIGGWSYGTTPEEVAGAYAAISNGGTFVEPHCVAYIELIETGEVINIDQKLNDQSNEAISEESSFMIRDIMKDYVKDTDGYSRLNLGYDIGAKTGTTNYPSEHPVKALQGKSKDRWMSAFSPDYSWSVWVGYPEEIAKEKGLYLKNGTDAAKISAEIAKVLHKDGVKNKYPEQPESVVEKTIVSGLYPYVYAGEDVPDIRKVTGYFKVNNTPSSYAYASELNALTNFTASEQDHKVTVAFAPYDPISATVNGLPTKDYSGKQLTYLQDPNQIWDKVVYKVDVNNAYGQTIYSQTFSENTGTLDLNFSSGVYTVSGYYAFENGTKVSNKITKTVIITGIDLPTHGGHDRPNGNGHGQFVPNH